MSWMRDDPILLVGMHRSGTTLLARQLEALGVFLGHHLEENHESVAFLEQNDRILARAHATWDRPAGVVELLDSAAASEVVVTTLQQATESLGFRRSYLGVGRIARGLGDGPWGFKDPRSTLTWPFWLRLAPRARLVHVRRHGIDVAASLWRRARQQVDADDVSRYFGDDHLARFASVRCLELERAFELWVEYVEGFEALRSAHAGVPVLDLLYEDLLDNPRDTLARVCAFLGLASEPERIGAVAERVDRSRKLAHRDDPALASFVESVRDHPLLASWESA